MFDAIPKKWYKLAIKDDAVKCYSNKGDFIKIANGNFVNFVKKGYSHGSINARVAFFSACNNFIKDYVLHNKTDK